MSLALSLCGGRIHDNISKISKTNHFQAIFAAPEYYFSQPTKGDFRVPLNEDDQVDTEWRILHLSRAYPKTLIMPGTVYYKKRSIPLCLRSKLNREKAMVVQTIDKRSKDRRQKAFIQLSDAMERDFKDDDTLPYVGYSASTKVPIGPTGLPLPSMFTKWEALFDKKPELVRNTTYLYLNGTRHGKYDKQTDYHESLNAPDQMVFVPGTRDECPIIGGYKFGVEICADHGIGRLSRRSPAGLAFHIVASDYVKNAMGNMAMGKEGYFLHASTDKDQTGVFYKDENGHIAPIKEKEKGYLGEHKVGRGNVSFWLLPLPEALQQ
jgi:predicted amidohydrolase